MPPRHRPQPVTEMSEQFFSRLPLPSLQLENLEKLGYQHMTPIQAASLPPALAGADLLAQAQTGSGKTAAFALPLLHKLNPRFFGTQALVLCPTRELATQVAAEIRRLARYQANIKVVTLCGGVSIGPQIGSLEHGAHVVVGTPGRISDHLRKKTLALDQLTTLVLDEADRMLEMGFIDEIASIIAHTPGDRQTLLFSATYPDDIRALSDRFQRSPETVRLTPGSSAAAIDQRFYFCERKVRADGLLTLLHHFQLPLAVVFCNTRQSVRDTCDYLAQSGVSAVALHGDMEQRDRDQALVQFRQQSCSVLVATDVAARGLDIDDLPAVINLELPRSADVYIHRIGRTGRAGKSGLALSLLSGSERYRLDQITSELDTEPVLETIEALGQGGGTIPPPPYRSLCIAAGRRDKIRPGDILGALTGDAGIAAQAVGTITVMDHTAYVAIERGQAAEALDRLRRGKIKGRKFKVREL